MNGQRWFERILDQHIDLAPPEPDVQTGREAAFLLDAVRQRPARLDEQIDVAAALRVIYTTSEEAHDGSRAELTGNFAFDDFASFVVKPHFYPALSLFFCQPRRVDRPSP